MAEPMTLDRLLGERVGDPEVAYTPEEVWEAAHAAGKREGGEEMKDRAILEAYTEATLSAEAGRPRRAEVARRVARRIIKLEVK